MAHQERFETVSGDALYRALVNGQRVLLLDVRTEDEFAHAHIPGSLLIPLHHLEQRMGELPNGGTPIAVVCEKGIRSVSACRLLAEHGFEPLMSLAGGLSAWPGPQTTGLERNGHSTGLGPSEFLVENFPLLPRGLTLDVAMGDGQNAIYLATRGFDVDGVDADPARVARARAASRKLGAPIRAIVGNVEDGTYIIPLEAYELILVFNYLYRPLFKDIRDGVVPGGVVVYQTFTVEQAALGRPTNPDYLLTHEELKVEFAEWEILAYREAVVPARRGRASRATAGIVARKP